MPCLHLGGRAAFNCFGTGESACERCKKRGPDIAKRCHQPTTEDIARMDRRCTRCKDKGNKVCDERVPCGGCIKQQAKDRSEGKPSFLVENCILDRKMRRQLAAQGVKNDEEPSVGEVVEDEHMNYDEGLGHDNVDDVCQGEEPIVEEHVKDIDGNEATISPEDEEDLGVNSLSIAAQETPNGMIVESNEPSPTPALASSIADQFTSTNPSDFDEEVTRLEARNPRQSSEPSESTSNRRRSRRSCTQVKCYKEVNMDDEGMFSDAHEEISTDDEEVYISQNSDSESDDDDMGVSEKSDSDHEDFGSDDEEDEFESRTRPRKPSKSKAINTGAETGSLPKLQKRTKQKGGPSRYLKKPTGEVIDQSLPPLNDIYDIFADMVTNAVKLGLCDALKGLERPINIGTLCSGTEAPLVAINLISEGLFPCGTTDLANTTCSSQ